MAALRVTFERDLSHHKSLFKMTRSAAIYFCAFSGLIVGCLGLKSAKICSRSRAITDQGAQALVWCSSPNALRSLYEQFDTQP